ncbi:MAG: hypothetical protein J0L61_04255 [Planctomycetes bacterium]|nr:hypothetical protein [Planctomycetota bacterium]
MKKIVLIAGAVSALAGVAMGIPPVPPPAPSSGPDVVVSGIGFGSTGVAPFGETPSTAVANNGTVGAITAYSIATISCNLGNVDAIWIDTGAQPNRHPVIGTQMYRYQVVNGAGQFEQVGMNWLKHGFCALDAVNCTQLTNPVGTLVPNGSCDWLGPFSTDTYSAGLNGQQSNLGPRSEVNPWTGAYPYPYLLQPGATGDAIFKRTQVKTAELTPAGNNWLFEAVYICTDEPAANRYNNYSYRQATLSGTNFTMANSTEALRPAIVGWKEKFESGVTIVNIDPSGASDGRLVLGYKVTQTGPTTWHYEYNLFNMNNHNSVRSFSVPMDTALQLSNVDFNDVDYHSGEPYSLTDWAFVSGGGAGAWSTDTFAQNNNANALRWSTMYSFRFDANSAPTTGTITLGMFRDGSTVAVNAVQVPSVPPPPTPGAFTLRVPGDGETVANLTPTFEWTDSSNADSYDITVATDPGLSNIVATANVATTTWTINSGALAANTEYWWGVTANNAFGTTGSSPVRSQFFTPPPVCVGDLNGDNATNTADLALFLGAFGTSVTPGTGADLNGDGNVNTADLALFLGGFGCGV